MSRAEDAWLRQRMHGLFRSTRPAPAPVDVIIRRGKGIRLRRTGAAASCLGLAGIVAATALLAARGGGQGSPQLSASAPASAAGPGGVFATGTVDGHPWRLAVQDIADPGQPCLAGVTINGTDADPVNPDQGTSAAVTLGSTDPGYSFEFIQVPAEVGQLVIKGSGVRAVTATVCGDHYRLIGFSYRLDGALQVIAVDPSPGASTFYAVPVPFVSAALPGATTQYAGIWDNGDLAGAPAASATIASGTASGNRWSIQLMFGSGGNCYAFEGTDSLGSNQMGACGPIGTPGGAETIVALPLGFANDTGATGYAVELSPGTACLEATFSDGTSELAYPAIVAGRKYAAFVVGDSVRLTRLAWLGAADQVLASTTAVPRYGDVQFQP